MEMVLSSLWCVLFLVNFDGSLNEISGLLCRPVLICNLKMFLSVFQKHLYRLSSSPGSFVGIVTACKEKTCTRKAQIAAKS